MVKFKYDGRELPVPETFTMGEALDLEQHLGIDLSKAGAASTSIGLLFIALRREDPAADPEKIAYDLRQADIESFDTEGDADPPAQAPPASSESGSEKKERSGEDSEQRSDRSTAARNSSGDRSLVTPT